jgi:hypothetical protein
MLKSLRAIVHENASVREALDLLHTEIASSPTVAARA